MILLYLISTNNLIPVTGLWGQVAGISVALQDVMPTCSNDWLMNEDKQKWWESELVNQPTLLKEY